MFYKNKYHYKHSFFALLAISLAVASCKIPEVAQSTPNIPSQATYRGTTDTVNTAVLSWRNLFTDTYLQQLIDTALQNNQELSITLQEIEMARNDVRARRGDIFPSVTAGAGIGVDKVGRYTSQGAGDATTEIKPGKEMPDPLGDYKLGIYANWEVDIWKKLRNAKKAAITRYLSTVEGKNFVLTNLVAEIANSYYELIALDNQLAIVRQNISLQQNALEIVKLQKDAARVTELAVQKFQAEVLNTQSLEFNIQQQVKETENRICLLMGTYPRQIQRDKNNILGLMPTAINEGIPSQLLENRPDIKQAELELEAAKLDVKVARAEFYPSLEISAMLGLNAFSASYITKLPESLLFSLAGDLVGPIINRNRITAEYLNANARQKQAMLNYERTILNAFLEVSTQLSGISNLEKSYELKSKEVDALTRSIDIANDLFKSARADYLEVLMTQRDALESKLELIETKKQQLNAVVNIYRDLGGGWK